MMDAIRQPVSQSQSASLKGNNNTSCMQQKFEGNERIPFLCFCCCQRCEQASLRCPPVTRDEDKNAATNRFQKFGNGNYFGPDYFTSSDGIIVASVSVLHGSPFTAVRTQAREEQMLTF